MEACHDDGVCTNNYLTNLRWDTKKNNEADKYRHGTGQKGKKRHDIRGELCPLAKLSWLEVNRIRKQFASGKHSMVGLGKMYGVIASTISDIIKEKTWKIQ